MGYDGARVLGDIQHQFEFKPAPLKTKGAAPDKSHNQNLTP